MSRFKYLNNVIIKHLISGKEEQTITIAKKVVSEAKLEQKFITQEKKYSDTTALTEALRKYISSYKATIDLSSTNLEVLEEKSKIVDSNVVVVSGRDMQNVLVIPDLHIPYEHKGVLQHCIDIYNKYNCGKVIFIGDIVDNHYSSFHTANPDGLSAKDELDLVIEKVKDWYAAFPEAIWILGNHDQIPKRKIFEGSLSSKWLKNINEVIGCPGWKPVTEYIYNGIYYVHGESATAKQQSMVCQMPTVQGHRHSQCYIQYVNQNLWGMQVGVGIDRESHAFAYAKQSTQAYVIGCAVVCNRTPIIEPIY